MAYEADVHALAEHLAHLLAAEHPVDPEEMVVVDAARAAVRQLWSVVNLPEPRAFSRWSTTSIVADSLWGSTPITIFFMDALALCREWMGRRGGHRYYELGSPLLSHASSRRPTVRKPK